MNVLFFLLLQVLALWAFFRYNKFHQAAFLETATELTGGISRKYNNIEYYFKLKKTNEDLARENDSLRNMLLQNFEPSDTASHIALDSIRVDSLEAYRRWKYQDAKVVGSFVSLQTNYIIIHRGARQGVSADDGVVGSRGIVGRVVTVSNNYASVMTALNRQFKTSVKLKKTGERGSIEWDGSKPNTLLLKDIQKSTPVAIGDTVVTSELSSIFPSNIMVGVVSEVLDDKSSNFHVIRIKTATNFRSVEYTYVVKDLQKEEKQKLEAETRKIQ